MLARSLVAIALALLPALRATAQGFTCEHGRPQPHIVVGNIVFRSSISLSPARSLSLRNQILDLTRGMDSQNWANGLRDEIEELTRAAYQDKGYLNADVHAELRQVSDRDKTATLIVNVDSGKQYRLIGITFRGMTAFSEDQLAKLVPFEPGSVFNRSSIVSGLEAIKGLYDSRGYIDFISTPTPKVDDSSGTLILEIEVDEGGQFHFGELDVEGMEQKHEEVLVSEWAKLRGQVFSRQASDQFFNRFFKSPLHSVRPEDYTILRLDHVNHVVNYEISLAPSPRSDQILSHYTKQERPH